MEKFIRTRLIEERKRCQWSQQEMADLIGTTQHNISRWEQGRTIPGSYFRAKLCELFGKSSEELDLLPGLQTTSDKNTAEVAVPGSPESFWSVPYPRNPFFTGRTEFLCGLRESLSREHKMALTKSWAICGLGGIGKTQIALEYAYRYRKDYRFVFWMNAATRESLLANIEVLAELLQLPEKDVHDHNRMIIVVKKWFATHKEWLLILDKADDVAIVQNVVPTNSPGHLILTTRAQALGSFAQKIEVEEMGMTESLLFLLRRAKILAPDAFLDSVQKDQLVAAEAIVIEAAFLPLALEQAGAYIDETGCDLAVYLELYRNHRQELLQRRSHLPNAYPESVTTTWSLAFQQIEQLNPEAADLWRLCAFLEPDCIPEDLFVVGGACLGTSLEPVTRDVFRLNVAIEELRKFSLIQRKPAARMLRIHPLVQTVLRDTMGLEAQFQWAGRAVRAVNAIFPEQVEVTNWLDCQRYLSQSQACNELIQDYELICEEAASLLFRTASYLWEQALYEQAELLYQRAVNIREHILGSNHPDVAQILNSLAHLYSKQGKYAEAEHLYQQTLCIWEQAFGPDHPIMANSLNGLAILCYQQGRYEQAEQLYRQALDIWEPAFGSECSESVQ